MTDGDWARIRDDLLAKVGKDVFRNWISPLSLVSVDGNVMALAAPTAFIGEWVKKVHSREIISCCQRAGFSINRLEFVVDESDKQFKLQNGNDSSEFRKGRETLVGESGLPGTDFNSRFNFDNFVVGKPNELAHAAALAVAEGGSTALNPLFLYGGVGLGKTHLMHAIGWKVLEQNPQANILYLSAEQFMYRFVEALRSKIMMDFKRLFRSVDMLMVDDVQFIAGKESTQEEFFHTFNALIDQRKQIVISGDRAPGALDGIEERIKSRLESGLAVDLHPTDYELRLGILQVKVEAKFAEYPDVHMADGVIDFLAKRLATHVRGLEGALHRLFASAALLNSEINLKLTNYCLSDMLKNSARKVTIDQIIQAVAKHYNLRMTDIVGRSQSRSVARPRQIAMYLAKTLTSASYPEIGRQIGDRDHTTVMYAIRRVQQLQSNTSRVADDINSLIRTLER